MEYFVLTFFILLFGAVATLFVKKEFKFKLCSIFTLIAVATVSVPLFFIYQTAYPLEMSLNMSAIFGASNFCIDPLSAFFIAVISLTTLLSTIYANGYIKQYLDKNKNLSAHCFFLMLLIASMLGVAVARNGLVFLIAWELMSLSSFFLVIFEGDKKEVLKAGIKYLVYMHLSIIFLIAMFAILTNASGSFDFEQYVQALANNRQLSSIVFILGFIGFGIKAGFVPFHTWLPDAHPAAPSYVSGIMSGVMIKTGIYGIMRILWLIGIPSKFIAYLVLIVAVISALYGVLYAITQHDIKRLLAYHSIENIGIIGIGIGVGMLGLAYSNAVVAIFGFAGGLLHILNHSIFKGLLFLASGGVYLKTHTRNVEEMGGLIKKMPYTALMFIVGSVAIAGLPMFNGFISEFLIYAGMLLGIPSGSIKLFIILVVSIAALAMVGTMAVLCFTKVSGIMFLGNPRSKKSANVQNDVDLSMLLPMGVLAFASFFIGIFPQYVIGIVLTPVSQFITVSNSLEILKSVISLMETLSWFFLGFLLLLIFVCLIKGILNKRAKEHTTWGCGYDRVNNHMQYTASSYANPFVSTLKPLFKRISHIKKPKELFPKEAYFEMEIEDIEEAYIVEPIIKLDEKILTKFERIQNGNMQQYILFGLIFLVLTIVGLIIYGG